MYKPGTDILGTAPDDIWVQQIGLNRPLSSSTPVPFDDGTEGMEIDCPGWITPIESQGSPTNTCDLFSLGYDETDGSSCLNCFGAWSGQNGGLAKSAESLGNIESGVTYTLSAMLIGNAAPVTFELQAGGVALVPSSSVTPEAPGDWEVISRTYEAADIAAFVGEPMTIVVGTSRPGDGDPPLTGTRGRFDNISLSYVPAPPVSLMEDFDSLAVGSSMHDVDGWQGWKGDPNAGAQVTDAVAYSGTNSLEIVGNRDDLEALWPVVNSGTYVLTVMEYVPATTSGAVWFWAYGLGTIVINCDTEKVYVNNLDAATRVEADLLRDQWVELKIAIDLDINACDFYYGDVLLGTRECTESNGVDIWPDGNVDVVYYDDFSFGPAQ